MSIPKIKNTGAEQHNNVLAYKRGDHPRFVNLDSILKASGTATISRDGDFLVISASGGGGGTGTSDVEFFNDLSDVEIITPIPSGHVVRYNTDTSQWESAAVPNSIADLSPAILKSPYPVAPPDQRNTITAQLLTQALVLKTHSENGATDIFTIYNRDTNEVFRVSAYGEIQLNASNTDQAFIVEGGTDQNLLVVNQGGNDKIGIGLTTPRPEAKVEVDGIIYATDFQTASSPFTGTGDPPPTLVKLGGGQTLIASGDPNTLAHWRADASGFYGLKWYGTDQTEVAQLTLDINADPPILTITPTSWPSASGDVANKAYVDYVISSGIVNVDHTELNDMPSSTNADHDGRYYTKSEIDASGINSSTNFYGTNWTDLTDSGETTLHTHDHGSLNGLGDDDHPQYVLHSELNASGVLTDTQATDLTDGGETALHIHDNRYYTQTEIDSSGYPVGTDIDYAYVTNNDGATDVTAAELEELTDGSTTTKHDHDSTYYTETEIDAFNYLSQTEYDTNIEASGYVVGADIDYSYVSGNDASTDVSAVELEELTDGSTTTLHDHDTAYYTQSELDTGQLDNRYYTQTELDASGIVPSGALDHGALTGLTNDHHTHYLLIDGSRAMTGDLDLGSNYVGWGNQALNFDAASGIFTQFDTVVGGTLRMEGLFTGIQGGVINEAGIDSNFRVEGDSNQYLIFADAGDNYVGIGAGTDKGGRLCVEQPATVSNIGFGTNAALRLQQPNAASAVGARVEMQFAGWSMARGVYAESVIGFKTTNNASNEMGGLYFGNRTSTSNESPIEMLYISPSGNIEVIAGDLDMNHVNNIINLADPVNNQDAATKAYIDDNYTTDHGSLDGLSDDDHGQYIFDNPKTDTRNVIQPFTAGIIALTLKGHASQTDLLFNVTDGSDNEMFAIQADGEVDITSQSNTKYPLTIHAAASQATQILRCQDSSNNDIAYIDANGGAQFNVNGTSTATFQVKGDADSNLLYCNCDDNEVGIGTNDPNAKLDVRGSAVFNDSAADADFRVESQSNPYAFWLDAAANEVGLGADVMASGQVVIEHQSLTGIPALKITGQPGAILTGNTLQVDDTNCAAQAANAMEIKSKGTVALAIKDSDGHTNYQANSAGSVIMNFQQDSSVIYQFKGQSTAGLLYCHSTHDQVHIGDNTSASEQARFNVHPRGNITGNNLGDTDNGAIRIHGVNSGHAIGDKTELQFCGWAMTGAQTGEACIGLETTSISDHEKGNLYFATRNTTGSSDNPTIRMVIHDDGTIDASGNYVVEEPRQENFTLVSPNTTYDPPIISETLKDIEIEDIGATWQGNTGVGGKITFNIKHDSSYDNAGGSSIFSSSQEIGEAAGGAGYVGPSGMVPDQNTIVPAGSTIWLDVSATTGANYVLGLSIKYHYRN